MVLVIHVIAAVLSLILATFTVISPGRDILRLSAALVTLTVVSGTYIIFTREVNLLPTCATGLLYLAFVSAELAFARYKLAKELSD